MLQMLALLLSASVAAADPAPAPSPTAADIPGLIGQLKSGDPSTRWNAAYTLGRLGSPAVPALLAVVEDRTLRHLGDVGNPARSYAVIALESVGPTAAEAVPVLLAILRDPQEDDHIRGNAASALGAIGARPAEVVPALAGVLEEPRAHDFAYGYDAIGALAAFTRNPEAHPALHAVLPIIKRVHRKYGPSASFAMILRTLAPQSPKQSAEEDLVQAVLIQEITRPAAVKKWCLTGFRSPAIERFPPLSIVADRSQCRPSIQRISEVVRDAKASGDGMMRSIMNAQDPSMRTLDLEYFDWMDTEEVSALTAECRYGSIPCHQTIYSLRKLLGRWQVISVEYPLAL